MISTLATFLLGSTLMPPERQTVSILESQPLAAAIQDSKRYYWNSLDFQVAAQFEPHCPFFRNGREQVYGRELPVGLSPIQFDYVINEVYKRMVQPDMDNVRRRPIPELAELIKSKVEDKMRKLQLDQGKPELLKNWLLAEAVCAWVSTHVSFNNLFIPGTEKVDVNRLRIPVLSEECPATNCSGFTRLTQALATAIGLKCLHAVGDYRWVTQSTGGRHSWVLFDFGNGIRSVADNVEAQSTLEGARGFPGKGRWDAILPKAPLEWELFLARHMSYQRLDGPFDNEVYTDTTECSMLDFDYATWKATDASSLKDVETKYLDIQANLVRKLSSFQQMPH